MNLNICYHPVTGEIRQIDNASLPPIFEGFDCIVQQLEDGQSVQSITIATHIVDVDAKILRLRTDAERAAFLAPKDHDIFGLVAAELAATDQFMMPDRMVSNREQWIAYRQQLRDLSKLPGSASDRLKVFPTRPDGVDASEHLRLRGAFSSNRKQ
jgi:hypothetical protein